MIPREKNKEDKEDFNLLLERRAIGIYQYFDTWTLIWTRRLVLEKACEQMCSIIILFICNQSALKCLYYSDYKWKPECVRYQNLVPERRSNKSVLRNLSLQPGCLEDSHLRVIYEAPNTPRGHQRRHSAKQQNFSFKVIFQNKTFDGYQGCLCLFLSVGI